MHSIHITCSFYRLSHNIHNLCSCNTAALLHFVGFRSSWLNHRTSQRCFQKLKNHMTRNAGGVDFRKILEAALVFLFMTEHEHTLWVKIRCWPFISFQAQSKYAAPCVPQYTGTPPILCFFGFSSYRCIFDSLLAHPSLH